MRERTRLALCRPLTTEAFREALQNPFFVRPRRDKKPERILEHLRAFGRDICFLAEEPYTDRDFASDHSHYYATAHREYPKVARRLHFFAINSEAADAAIHKILVDGSEAAGEGPLRTLQDAYLGFVVVKPLPIWVLGRTVLRPPPSIESFVTSGRDNDVNLFGIPLRVERSLAWQEQDTVISACATTALWSAFHKTAHDFGYYVPTPYEITTSATRAGTAGRSIPSQGLTVEQMSHAIRGIGLDADMKECTKVDASGPSKKHVAAIPLLSHCYAFLRGGIPVVLDVLIEKHGRHAVTLVGYELGEKHPAQNELQALGLPEPRLRGSRITRFVAHDDQVAPFVTLDVHRPASSDLINLKTQWPYDVNGGLAQGQARAYPHTVITPIYHKIRVSPMALMPHLAELRTFLGELTLNIALQDDVEFDLYLCKSNEYKAELSKSKTVLARRHVLMEPLPRFIWRARCDHAQKPLFELAADSTDIDASFQFGSLVFYDTPLVEQLREHFKTDSPTLRRLIPPMRKLVLNSLEEAAKS